MTFTAVLPVKHLAVAKSRLAPPSAAREALALAMAIDVAAAVRQVCPLLVVTDDPLVARALPGNDIEPDVPGAGLTAAVAHGIAVALRRDPGSGVVVLAADLPALRPAALNAVLQALSAPDARAQPGPPAAGVLADVGRVGVVADAVGVGVVADAAGVGTVLLAAVAGCALTPAFEGGSFARHRRGGACDLTSRADPGLRRDVDTLTDLAAAVALGVGPATAESLHRFRESWRSVGLT